MKHIRGEKHFKRSSDNMAGNVRRCVPIQIKQEVIYMDENRKSLKIKEDQFGEIRVVDDVVTIIAGLAATEVEGVGSMAGNITNEIVAKTGAKNLSKGVRVDVTDGIVTADLNLNIRYGYAIPEVSGNVQERVRTAIENMTGLEVGTVNVRIASVDMAENK